MQSRMLCSMQCTMSNATMGNACCHEWAPCLSGHASKNAVVPTYFLLHAMLLYALEAHTLVPYLSLELTIGFPPIQHVAQSAHHAVCSDESSRTPLHAARAAPPRLAVCSSPTAPAVAAAAAAAAQRSAPPQERGTKVWARTFGAWTAYWRS
jgi:hypothetical protein